MVADRAEHWLAALLTDHRGLLAGFGSYGAEPFEFGSWVWLSQIRHLLHAGQVKCVGSFGHAISHSLLFVCSRMLHMNAVRTERITVNLSPELLAKLDLYAQEHRWTRSAAVQALIERGLAEDEALWCPS